MNTISKDHTEAQATGLHQRRDARSRDIVDHAIAVQETANTMAAVEYLKSHDVAPHVITRVLLDPARRRSAALV